ncbi:MAG: glycosyltransferase family 39 protein [Nanoarchaeota archaeon]|nr:glycosyltransferase family 39 protein [Nanoarchaeota archaeon]
MREIIQKRKAEIFLGIILLAFVTGNIIAITRNNIPDWDESVYIGMGKYIFSWGNAGEWELLRPLPLALLAGLSWKIGLNPIYAGKIIGVLFSVLNIILTYKIGKELFSKKAGLFAAFFLAITPVFFSFSNKILTEMPSVFFTLLALWLLIKNKNILLVGVCAGISFLVKFPNGLFMIVLAALLLLYAKKEKTGMKPVYMCIAGFGIAILPFIVFNLFMYGNELNPLEAMFRPMLSAAGVHSNPFYPGGLLFYVTGLLKTNPFLVFSIAGLFFLFKRKDFNIQKTLPVAYVIASMLYFSIIVDIKDLRFALLFLPFLAVLAGHGAVEIARYKRIGYAILAVMLIAAIPAAYYGITRSNYLSEPSVRELKEFFSYFNNHPTNGIVLTTLPYPMAYSDARFRSIFYVGASPEQILKGVSAAILLPSALKCTEHDLECIKMKESFFKGIYERGKPVASIKYWEDNLTIYLIS